MKCIELFNIDVYIPSETEQLSVILISANISKELVLVLYMSYEC